MPTTKTATRKKSSQAAKETESMGNSPLEKFFHESLKDIYWAEKAVLKYRAAFFKMPTGRC